ncbi:MAG: hypothetical protein GXP41_04355 [Chloroflexi bacterium]|nr:hypothetical protein [Chloroflexota bacterium]
MKRKARYALAGLETFSKNCIAAEQHPNDIHLFTPIGCPVCGIVPLELTIEHHSGSEEGNFKGMIFARCQTCKSEERVFCFTGEHRHPVREEKPICECGNTYFLIAECERIERDEGLPGFFDEGVITGLCSRCGRSRAFVYTD